MPIEAPGPLRHSHPLAVLISDLREERSNKTPYPPGETDFSLARTKRFMEDACGVLVESYERFGPVFTLRILFGNVVFMIGPAANHYLHVTNASNFTIRESHFRSFVDIIGDGILMTDGEYHRWMRKLVLPAMHRESIASHLDVMVEETERALESMVPGEVLNIFTWTHALSLRIMVRTLFGFDPDGERSAKVAAVLEQFNEMPILSGSLRGPFTPWARFQRTLGRLDEMLYREISERRARGGGGTDIMSMLIDARDEDGAPLTDLQVRDQVMTLLLAGRDTTSLELTFLVHELALHPEVVDRIVAEREALSGGDLPSVEQLMSGELVELEMALDETLRMYPSAWISPRRATESFEFEGVTVPANAYVDCSGIATHYLPEVFPEPELFKPERFVPELKAALPKGAFVPFGGGSRTCIGMRFAQLELRTIATLLLRRFELELAPGFSLKLGQVPLLVPKEGVLAIVSERAARRDRVALAAGL